MFRVLVCGSRTFTNDGLLHTFLGHLKAQCKDTAQVLVIIHGDARGADRMAGRWADDNHVLVKAYPADWDRYGKRAGYVRNQQMLDEGKPDLVVAFPEGESRGTRMMMEIARKAGVEVIDATQ